MPGRFRFFLTLDRPMTNARSYFDHVGLCFKATQRKYNSSQDTFEQSQNCVTSHRWQGRLKDLNRATCLYSVMLVVWYMVWAWSTNIRWSTSGCLIEFRSVFVECMKSANTSFDVLTQSRIICGYIVNPPHVAAFHDDLCSTAYFGSASCGILQLAPFSSTPAWCSVLFAFYQESLCCCVETSSCLASCQVKCRTTTGTFSHWKSVLVWKMHAFGMCVDVIRLMVWWFNSVHENIHETQRQCFQQMVVACEESCLYFHEMKEVSWIVFPTVCNNKSLGAFLT